MSDEQPFEMPPKGFTVEKVDRDPDDPSSSFARIRIWATTAKGDLVVDHMDFLFRHNPGDPKAHQWPYPWTDSSEIDMPRRASIAESDTIEDLVLGEFERKLKSLSEGQAPSHQRPPYTPDKVDPLRDLSGHPSGSCDCGAWHGRHTKTVCWCNAKHDAPPDGKHNCGPDNCWCSDKHADDGVCNECGEPWSAKWHWHGRDAKPRCVIG